MNFTDKSKTEYAKNVKEACRVYDEKIIKDKILGKTKMKRMTLDDVTLKEYVKGNLFDARNPWKARR